MSTARHLIFGAVAAGAPVLVTAYGDGGDDLGQPYNGLGRSSRVAIAGVGGEVAFYALYIAIVFEGAALPILVTPIVDDVARPAQAFTLENPGAGRFRTVVEVPLTLQLPDTIANHAARGEWALRGMWFQVELATAYAGPTAYVQVDGVELEHEILREGRPSGQAT